MSCIEIKNISKRFKDTLALDNVSIKFEEGKIYGLLGRNGAGKSTLLKILSNRIFSDSGEVLIDGEKATENDSAQTKIYLMSESNLYPQKMKIKNAFKLTKSFYPNFDTEYAENIAIQFGLDLNKKIGSLSTGYNSIFKIVISLAVNVPYVFLDEPVLGLDANHRDMFYRMLIEKYSENPFCCVISTHLIEEVSTVIEEVVIIKEGRIIRNESRDALLETGYTVSGVAEKVDAYIKDKEVISVDTFGGLKTACISGKLDKNGLPEGLELTALDLQKLFVQLTN
ncbi:MAG: ABC transporter ATP-binding protein [Oscillospiraceae bacterium]|nr:ABC transporter ATP-binding protein [Oscillospiraceae bacterium]